MPARASEAAKSDVVSGERFARRRRAQCGQLRGPALAEPVGD